MRISSPERFTLTFTSLLASVLAGALLAAMINLVR